MSAGRQPRRLTTAGSCRGALIGAALGTFFGLAFGGAMPHGVTDYCFGPEEEAAGE